MSDGVVRFESPGELAGYLYDRAMKELIETIEPDMRVDPYRTVDFSEEP